MPVADIPPGEWTGMLIGDQWPSSNSVDVIYVSSAARGKLAYMFENYADLLLEIHGRQLVPQEGVAAESIRFAFDRGISDARHIAEANRIKSESYAAVHRTVSEFRSRLRELAANGNHRIDLVNRSKKSLPEKVAEISGIVMETKDRANLTALSCAGDINTHIRDVLAAQGVDTSPQAYAAEFGVGSKTGMPTDIKELKAEIGRQLDRLVRAESTGSPNGTLSGTSSSEGGPVRSPATIDQGAAPPQPIGPTTAPPPQPTVGPTTAPQSIKAHPQARPRTAPAQSTRAPRLLDQP